MRELIHMKLFQKKKIRYYISFLFCQEYDVNFEADIPEDNSLLSEDLSFDGVDKKVRVPGWCQSARFIPYDRMSQIRPQLRYSVKCWREYRTAIKMRGILQMPS